MAVYEFDITTAEVLDVLGHAPSTSDAEPANATIALWITQYCGDVGLVLRGVGITPSSVTAASDDELYEVVRLRVIDRVSARWDMASQRGMTEYAQQLIEEWDQYLVDLRELASWRTGSTGHGVKPRASSGRTRSSVDIIAASSDRMWITKEHGFS